MVRRLGRFLFGRVLRVTRPTPRRGIEVDMLWITTLLDIVDDAIERKSSRRDAEDRLFRHLQMAGISLPFRPRARS
jgi:hypothetical protein